MKVKVKGFPNQIDLEANVYTGVQQVKRSLVSHATIALSAYCQVPFLHRDGMRSDSTSPLQYLADPTQW